MQEGGVNVTPLIDIVMCLIIFFMLIAKIGVTSGALAMPDLVKSTLGVTTESLGNSLTLNVLPDTNHVDAKISVLVPGQSENKILEHKELVDLMHYLNKNDPTHTFKVIIRAEAYIPYSMIQMALIATAEAGVGNIDFNTQAGE